MIRTRIVESKMATVKTISRSILLSVFVFILISNDRVGVAAFSTLSSSRTKPTGTRNNGGVNSIPALFSKNHEHDRIEIDNRHSESELPTAEIVSACQKMGKQTTAIAAGVAIAIATASTTLQPANAYIPSDYASETVQSALKDLKSASGKADETFKIYESIAAIITEGKGVGGQVNYRKYGTLLPQEAKALRRKIQLFLNEFNCMMSVLVWFGEIGAQHPIGII